MSDDHRAGEGTQAVLAASLIAQEALRLVAQCDPERVPLVLSETRRALGRLR